MIYDQGDIIRVNFDQTTLSQILTTVRSFF